VEIQLHSGPSNGSKCIKEAMDFDFKNTRMPLPCVDADFSIDNTIPGNCLVDDPVMPEGSGWELDSTTVLPRGVLFTWRRPKELSVTDGSYRVIPVSMDIDEGVGVVTTEIVNFPYPIGFIRAEIICRQENHDDLLSCYAPKALIFGGKLTQEIVSGNSDIYVDALSLASVFRGYEIELVQGATVIDMGEVVSHDKENSKLTMSVAASQTITPTPEDPVYLRMTKIFCENLTLVSPVESEYGHEMDGSSIVPVGVSIVLEYKNVDGVAGKKFNCNLSIAY